MFAIGELHELSTRQELLNYITTCALPAIQGWCSVEKATKFVEIILERKPEVCVEIGVFGGSSLIPQALALKFNGRGIAYGIDPWSNSCALEEMKAEANVKWWGTIDLEDIYRHCQKNIRKYQVQQHCQLIRAKSEDAVERFADESIDLLFIDGNHSELLSHRDAVDYLPKVKRGGIIFFDDVGWTEGSEYVTTKKALQFLSVHCEKLGLIGDCMILEKR